MALHSLCVGPQHIICDSHLKHQSCNNKSTVLIKTAANENIVKCPFKIKSWKPSTSNGLPQWINHFPYNFHQIANNKQIPIFLKLINFIESPKEQITKCQLNCCLKEKMQSFVLWLYKQITQKLLVTHGILHERESMMP